MNTITLPRFKRFSGDVKLPGSKSIANRALLLASLSEGGCTLLNVPSSDDVMVLRETLPKLGIQLEQLTQSSIRIHGCGNFFPVQHAQLNLENAGTALRPLTAILSAGEGRFIIDGNQEMRRRPIADLVAGLKLLGVDIESRNGYPPVTVHANKIGGGVVQVSGKVSSQYISALLMAAPLFLSRVEFQLPEEPVSKPYIDMTIAMMKQFGVEVFRDGYRSYRIDPQTYRAPKEYMIEGDASAATYFLGAGSLPGSGSVTVHGLGKNSIQGDTRFCEVLERMGATLQYHENGITATGPAHHTKLKALDIDMNDMPDAAMTLAVLALYADQTTHIRNIANLRVKESERIHGLKSELEKLGAHVIEEEDALHITPMQCKHATIETYSDHRMVMAFSLASNETSLIINNPECVNKTYPNFFDDFLSIAKSESS